MDYCGNDFVRRSLDEEGEEFVKHLLCDCPAKDFIE